MSNGGTVGVSCARIGIETPKAVEIELDDGRVVWVPWSQLTEIHREEHRVVVTEWFAKKEDL